MIILNKVCKEYGDKTIFKDLDLTIYNSEKIGIVGLNGSGKSTLLSIISQDIDVDSGSVHTNDTIGYVKQVTSYTCKDFETISYDAMQKADFIKTNKELNISEDLSFNKERLKYLSGGERTKLMISSILSKSPTTLLLDEPTNHLDRKGILWLQDRVNEFNGTVIIVSHDRDFLNNTVNKILEVEDGKVNEFYGNYNDYKLKKQEITNSQTKKYNEQQAMKRRIERQIKELKQNASKVDKKAKRDGSPDSRVIGFKDSIKSVAGKLGKTAVSKENRLLKEEQNFIDRPKIEKEIFYNLKSSEIASKILIKAENLSKQYDNTLLFADSNFSIENGEKVALIGDNGTGKTTLLKIILGEESFSGSLWKAGKLKIAYLSQEILEVQDDETIIERASTFGILKTQFLTNLANMNINRNLFTNKIKNLSLGERMKIKMNELILNDFNFLILDEPTNHLDVANKEFLEKLLNDFKGACIIVSHDKAFLDNICTKTLLIKDKRISIIEQ